MPDDNSTPDTGDHAFGGDFTFFGTLEEIDAHRKGKAKQHRLTEAEIDFLLKHRDINEAQAANYRASIFSED